MDERRVTALLAAAGRGSRLGAPVPKAFVSLRGRTLVERSVRAMATSGVIDEVIVLVSPDMSEYARTILDRAGLLDDSSFPVRLVHGGGERADSVWAGLQAIDAPDGVVVIHDAARALTPPGLIARVVQRVRQGEIAVIPVLPVTDTIKVVDRGRVVDTPPRVNLRAVQTPQGFDLAALRAANLAYFSSENPVFTPTDDASLMEWAGHTVTCVKGDPMALKVTTPLDMILARHITDEVEPTIFEVPGD
ncbi:MULTISPECIES: 2-C-methyl-D-erythritol 4-phosphate cytidylyltransferase [unclassified Corynebacterium]|uniref:2-C-methyl-D-erythritol 4-phosphate cytidylyltransferase n=1 Tax=unclassified Corynebacterium TaxID=2624378 RepID=UPI003525059A